MDPSVGSARIPAWDLRQLTSRACPVCQAEDGLEICRRPDGLPVRRCPGCGMHYLPHLPSASEVDRFYQSYGAFKTYQPPHLSRRTLKRQARRDIHLHILEQTGGLAGRHLLEYGCSYGTFLQLARLRGARVSGIEPDQAARAYVSSLGITVSPSAPPAPSAEPDLDIVGAFQVLEHVADPDAFIAEASRRLRRHGRLLLGIPNGREAEVVGPTWAGFRVDLEHFNYFSIGTLSRLLARHGLYVDHFWEYMQPVLQPPVPPTRWARVRRLILGDGACPPPALSTQDFFWKGTFILTVLARKAH
jgi:SAM-dependent methyltransferase